MTPKQITAANRILATLRKTEATLRKSATSDCAMLESVVDGAVRSNQFAQKTITMWLEMEAKNAQ
jgi:hypothetical protein